MNGFKIAVTGDSIINRRISVQQDPGFLSLVNVLRNADVSYTHFESNIHDYDGPEVYPAAEAGWTWMRSPRFVADELKWAGFDMVSHASNHCLDYSYGGLFSTWKALDEAGLVHAGTGRNLGEAREPKYLETPKGRVALISMSSTFTGWARAGETRQDVKGRPGLNPLRYYYSADRTIIETVKDLAYKMGWGIANNGKEWYFNPPGLMMAIQRFVERDEPGITTVVDEDDAAGNLKAIKEAARQADHVIVALHSHEMHPEKGLNVPAEFVQSFAKSCIDAGASVFVGQGSHAPLRGIEIYNGKPIFYDPGDFFAMSSTVTRLPADFFARPGYKPELKNGHATTADGFDARDALPKPLNPPGGHFAVKVFGSIIPVCTFNETGEFTELVLYPVTMDHKPRSTGGIPRLAEGELGEQIIEYLGELSAPFGTHVEYSDGKGIIRLKHPVK